ncbi:hypothetical protein SAMN05216332_110136 [Nitrosospira briensis]|nr:hypothetical protein SAMN05216332_110136 [Nitrosospira briensis]
MPRSQSRRADSLTQNQGFLNAGTVLFAKSIFDPLNLLAIVARQ